MIYGRVRFQFLGDEVTAELTDVGWRIPGNSILAEAFDAIASPSDASAADGNPMEWALAKMAGMMRSTYELTPIPAPPAGTIY